MCAVAQLDGHLLDHFLHHTPRHPPVPNLVDDVLEFIVVVTSSNRVSSARRPARAWAIGAPDHQLAVLQLSRSPYHRACSPP
eukprot:11158459-Heterocapsa_arctica.AAC.1